jgi:ATP-binding cassette subfamily B protein
MASAERIFHILDTEPEIIEVENAEDIGTIKGGIKFENVTFGYDPNDRIVLKNINFEAKPGEVVALVGPTGAGKSSIINLLMRFYDPNQGRILVDGKDISEVTLSSFRNQIGLVLQDSFVFSGTIKENISYGKLDATEAEIVKAAEAVKVNQFAEKFKDKYDTEVEERGAKLSTGQRQLLSFARALVTDPRILILDEATSSVDTETEKYIQDALKRMFADRTCIVIAHRLSTIEHADKIIVIDNGQIAELGTHDSLLKGDGLYKKLYNKQFIDDEIEEAV